MTTKYVLAAVFVTILYLGASVCSPDNTDAADNDTYTGRGFLKLGKTLNKPLFRLIGKALMNLECRLDMCAQWSTWSRCDLVLGDFGVKTRSRRCGSSSSSSCRTKTQVKHDTESQLCQTECPSDFIRLNGFCLKFHNKSTVGKASASSTCQGEGAFLVNVNTQQKWNVIETYLKENKYTTSLWVDGQRQRSGSPWAYSYEYEITGFSNWLANEPSNGPSELCKAMYYRSSAFKLIDAECSNAYYFICEKL